MSLIDTWGWEQLCPTKDVKEVEDIEIKLNRAYVSSWDNIQYPIFELSDGAYLCITYSSNHKCYHINTYTKEELIEQGFQEDDYCDDLFENLTREEFSRWL